MPLKEDVEMDEKDASTPDGTQPGTTGSSETEPTTEKPLAADQGSVEPKSRSAGEGAAADGVLRSLSGRQVSLKALATGLGAMLLCAALIVMAVLLVRAENRVDDYQSRDAAHAKVEKIATDYAVGAAQMDYRKIDEWKSRLTKGVSPELSNRLTQAATSMEQITAPMQWVSTSTPVTAKVRSEKDGKYVVDCFVSVVTKNSQAPEGVQSTATYAVTIDPHANWTITDVGGIGAMLGAK